LSLVLLRRADYRFRRGTKVLEENFAGISNDSYRNFFIKRPQLLPKAPEAVMVQDKLDLGDNNGGTNLR
jgi:hypothetical protein